MKKIPIFLSTLMLLTGANALVLVGNARAEGELTSQGLLGAARMAAEGLATDATGDEGSGVGFVTNSYDGRFWIDQVWPREETVLVSAKVEEANRGLKRVVLLMMDYRLVSMAQADKEWENWDGHSLPYWTLVSMEYDTIGPRTETYQPVWMGLLNIEKENRTDVVYYYAEMGGWNGEAPEILRGKIDYRDCVEDRYMEENSGDALVCKAEVDTENGELRYALNKRDEEDGRLVYVGTGELAYATWADEFRAILQGWVTELDDDVAVLEGREEIAGEQEIVTLEGRVEDLRGRLAETSDTGELEEQLDGLAARLAVLRKKYFPTEVTDPNEGGGSEEEPGDDGNGSGGSGDSGAESGDSGDGSDLGDDLGNEGGFSSPGNGLGDFGGPGEGGSENGSGEGSSENGDGFEAGGSEDNPYGVGGSGDGSGNGNPGENSGVSDEASNSDSFGAGSGAIGVTEAKDDVIGAADGMVSGDRDDTDGMVSSDRGDTDGVEVPNLGGEESVLWPWILLFLSVAGVSGWWLWRAFGPNRKSIHK